MKLLIPDYDSYFSDSPPTTTTTLPDSDPQLKIDETIYHTMSENDSDEKKSPNKCPASSLRPARSSGRIAAQKYKPEYKAAMEFRRKAKKSRKSKRSKK